MSTEGVQQGDPFGQLRFCLSIHCHCAKLKSFCVLHLDNVTIGGNPEDISDDLNVNKEAEVLGLALSKNKSEIICKDTLVESTILWAIPGAQVIPPEKVTLLCSLLSDVASVDTMMKEKIKALFLMGARFKYMSAHDSLLLVEWVGVV